MTSISTVENKISSVRKYLKILEKYKGHSAEEIEKDETLRGALERYLYLVVQSTISLAEATISYKNLRKPSTMSESFLILKDEKIISDDLAQKMVNMTGFRNIVAHDYEKIDYKIVHNIVQKELKDINVFLKKISNIL